MSHSDPSESFWSRPISWPSRHPATAIILAGALALLALLAIRRIKTDASIGSMLAKDDPAAAAMLSVLKNFSAVDELLVLVSIPAFSPPATNDTQRLIAYAES